VSEPSRGGAYVDTSALVKLVVREAESDALESALSSWRGLATSSITTIELQRAAQRARTDDREGIANDETIAVLLAAVAQIPLSAFVRQTAASLQPVELRTLDAIHLASALALGNDLATVVTYDQRMAAAANALGLQVAAPA
jgi:predicted nucleic acid-binding protein